MRLSPWQVLCDNVLRVTGRSRESLSSWSRCRHMTRNKRPRELEALLEMSASAGFTESGRKVRLHRRHFELYRCPQSVYSTHSIIAQYPPLFRRWAILFTTVLQQLDFPFSDPSMSLKLVHLADHSICSKCFLILTDLRLRALLQVRKISYAENSDSDVGD